MSLRFSHWLRRLLEHGESIQTEPPHIEPGDRRACVELLQSAFATRHLDIAGPTLPFVEPIALASAELLARACWQLVNDDNPDPSGSLRFVLEPRTAADHFTADVLLRFLPTVFKRAKVRSPDSPLTRDLDTILRVWPLSGVLADLDGEPSTPPEFGGHSGLQLLYAERLVRTVRPGWVPTTGPAREWAERVFQERGKLMPSLPHDEEKSRV